MRWFLIATVLGLCLTTNKALAAAAHTDVPMFEEAFLIYDYIDKGLKNCGLKKVPLGVSWVGQSDFSHSYNNSKGEVVVVFGQFMFNYMLNYEFANKWGSYGHYIAASENLLELRHPDNGVQHGAFKKRTNFSTRIGYKCGTKNFIDDRQTFIACVNKTYSDQFIDEACRSAF